MRVMIAAKEGTEILVDILNQSFGVGKIREICGQDKFSMPNGYTDFSRYAGLHKNDRIGEGKYADMTYGDFLVKLGSFTGKGGYLDKLIRDNMKSFTEGNDPGKRLGLFNRLYPGLMKYFRKDFKNLFKDFDLANPFMSTHYTSMLRDVSVGMNAIFGNHGRYLRDMNSAINRFVAGNLDLEQFRGELNSIQDGMSGSGESNGTAVDKAKESAWKRLDSSCRVSVPGSDPKYTWYKVDNHEDLWPIASDPATSWCVAQKGNSGRSYFDDYGAPYYMQCDGHRPVALLHVDSRQFKDAEDEPIELDRPSSARLVASGMKLLEKLKYSGGYRGDFGVFGRYIVDGADRFDVADDIGRIRGHRDDLVAVSSLSDDEFARRLRDSGFSDQMRDALADMDVDSAFSLLGESKLGMMAGMDRKLDERLLGSGKADEGMAMRILSAGKKRHDNMGRLFFLIAKNSSESCVLSVMERFLCPELMDAYNDNGKRLFSEEGAKKAAGILLDGAERGSQWGVLSMLGIPKVIENVLRMSSDGRVIGRVIRNYLDSDPKKDDGILWNIVRNGSPDSLSMLLARYSGRLDEGMIGHLIRRHSGNRKLIGLVIREVPLNRELAEELVGLGSHDLDRSLLAHQELDDELVLKIIHELGDDYKGELNVGDGDGGRKYGSEVVDAALGPALRNGRGGGIIGTQELSEGNVRTVVEKGKKDDVAKLVESQRLPGDVFDGLLSSGKYDSNFARNQPLDDGQIDEMVKEHGDKAVEWIARNDRIASRHAYDLILDGLDSSGVAFSLLDRKSIDWERVLPAALSMYARKQDLVSGALLMRAVVDHDDDDSLLSVVGALDSRSDFFADSACDIILDNLLKRKMSRRLIDGILVSSMGGDFARRMVMQGKEMDPHCLHYIAENFEGVSVDLAHNSGRIILDGETVELLKRWDNGEIAAELLKHGYLDKDMDADEVDAMIDQFGFDFDHRLHQVKNLGDGFIEYAEKRKDADFASILCGNPFMDKEQVTRLLAIDPQDEDLRRLAARNNGNGEVIRMFKGADDPKLIWDLLANDQADKSVLKEVCSTYRGEMTRKLADRMYSRLGMVSPIEKSRFLFDVMRKNSSDFKDEKELARLYGIGDDDVKWLCLNICRKMLGMALPVSESRTARIASRICRRIVRMRRIAERISR